MPVAVEADRITTALQRQIVVGAVEARAIFMARVMAQTQIMEWVELQPQTPVLVEAAVEVEVVAAVARIPCVRS